MTAALGQQVDEYLRAGFTGLWIQTYEFQDAINEINPICAERGWPSLVWDFEAGVKTDKATTDALRTELTGPSNNFRQKPLPLLQAIPEMSQKIGREQNVVWMLKNFHHPQLIQNLAIMQATQNALLDYRHEGAISPCVIVLSPIVDIPRELEKDFVVIDHELPSRETLWDIATNICEEGEVPQEGDGKRLLLEAGSGMTRRNFEDAVGLSLAKHGDLRHDVVWDLKSQDLKKRGLLTIYSGNDNFDDLGGFTQAKDFCLQVLKPQDDPLLRARGLLLLGVPGSGKSAFAKCLGNATNRKVLILDMGTLRGKYQGESDRNIDQALKIADAMQPCVLFVDEIEKALSGAGQSSAMTDGGTGDRMFGKLLGWLNDHTSDVFFLGTCNNISMLPPEFSRAERFDGVFFFDVPTKTERKAIWQIYLNLYKFSDSRETTVDSKLLRLSEGWTGAEIKACCRLAAMRGVSLEEAAKQVVPVVSTADAKLRDLREWASGRCLNASAPGLYDAAAKQVVDVSASPGAARRTITRGASLN